MSLSCCLIHTPKFSLLKPRSIACFNETPNYEPNAQVSAKSSIPRWQNMLSFSPSSRLSVVCFNGNSNFEPNVENFTKRTIPRWQNVLATAASLYPVYVTVGGVVACFYPSAFSWFVKRGPFSYSLSLGLIMLAMGLTLELQDLINLFKQRPFSVGMQNSSLGVVLAASHFSSPLVALPPALSAVVMNIIGSSLGFIWRNIDPKSNSEST